MNDKLNGRVLYLPRGRDPIEDQNTLAECIAASDANLFNQGGQMVWLKGTGDLVGVSRNVLNEIVTTYIVTKHLVNHADKWNVEFRPFQPDEMTLSALLKEDGCLVWRLPKLPVEPRRLTERQRAEAQTRLRTGEPALRIAKAMGVDADTIEQAR